MKLKLHPDMTLEAMTATLQKECPQYETALLKNPLLGFQYIEVKKSGFVGVWIRSFDKKGHITLIKAIPSAMARGFLGGLLLILIVNGAQGRVRKDVEEALKRKYNTENV